MSVPLALFTGAIVVRLRREGVQAVVTIGLLAVVIIANRPQVDWLPLLPDSAESIAVPSVAQFERETGALGTSSASEFRPRWSQATEYVPANDPVAASMEIAPRSAGTHSLEAAISTSGGPLRFATLYFPGWRVLLNGRPVTTYPSTTLVLLTIDVPPGSHDLRVTWGGTPVQRLASLISLITLAVLVLFVWYVSKTPSPTTRIRWQLEDSAGNSVSEITTRPYVSGSINRPNRSAVDRPFWVLCLRHRHQVSLCGFGFGRRWLCRFWRLWSDYAGSSDRRLARVPS